MQQKDFSINDAVSFGWETMKNNIGFFILVLLIFWAASGILSALSSVSRYMPLVAAVTFGLIFGVASFVLSMFINIAQFKIGLGFCDQKPADFNDLYTGYPYFLDFLVGSILYALIVIGGLILLIIPGIYWAVRYQYFGYLIIDRGMKPVDAIRKSGEITRGVWWHLFLFWLASVGIVIIGAILCGVGLLFAIPIVMVAVPYVYRTLLAQTPSAQGLEPPQLPPQPQPQPQGPPAT